MDGGLDGLGVGQAEQDQVSAGSGLGERVMLDAEPLPRRGRHVVEPEIDPGGGHPLGQRATHPAQAGQSDHTTIIRNLASPR